MKKMLGMVVCLLTVALAANPIGAVPVSMSYVGELTSPNGIPISANLGIVASVFTQLSGGSAVWSENLGTVSVVGGRFDVVVCNANCASLAAAVANYDNLWLEFTVGGQVLTPRQRVHSIPFALRAGDADSLGGTAAAEFVTVGGLLPALDGEFASANTACGPDAVMTGVDASGQPVCNGTPFSSQACSDCLAPLSSGQANISSSLATLTTNVGTLLSGVTALSAAVSAVATNVLTILDLLSDIGNDTAAILASLATQASKIAFLGNGSSNHGVDTSAVVPNPTGSVLERMETLQGSPNLHGVQMLQSEFLTLYRGGPVATWSVKINNGVLDQSVANTNYTNLVQGRTLHQICQNMFGGTAQAQVVAAGNSGYESANYTAYVAMVYPVVPVLVIKDAWSHGPAHIGTVIASSCSTYANEVWSSAQCSSSFADRYNLNGYSGFATFVLPCVR